MFEICLSFNLQDKKIYNSLYNKLICNLKECEAIIVKFCTDFRLDLLISCPKIYRDRVECYIKSAIANVICFEYKKYYLENKITIIGNNNLIKQAFFQALVCFDIDTDIFIASRTIKIGKYIDIYSYYMFMMNDLRNKWEELVRISNENKLYLSSFDAITEFLHFLIENIEVKSDIINVVQKNNQEYEYYDANLNKIESFKLDDSADVELIRNLILLSAKNINLYVNEGGINKDLKYMIDKVFFDKINYYEINDFCAKI